MLGLREVVDSWRKADPKFIHPTREHVSEQAYWDSGRHQAELVFELVGPDATVLDFGCGDGRIAIPMAKLGLAVIAMDAAPEMIERLHHNIEIHGNGAMWSYVCDGTDVADVHDDWPVDAVTCRAVLIHHSHADGAMLVKNLASVIRPGGLFIADWPVGEHHERRDWIDVTTWNYDKRQTVADAAGLELVTEGIPTVRPSVWRKQQ